MTRKKLLLIAGVFCVLASAVPFYIYFTQHQKSVLFLGLLWAAIGIAVVVGTLAGDRNK